MAEEAESVRPGLQEYLWLTENYWRARITLNRVCWYSAMSDTDLHAADMVSRELTKLGLRLQEAAETAMKEIKTKAGGTK